jgi:hypothetical protein
MSRTRLLDAVDALESAIEAGRSYDTRNRLRDLRALIVLIVPATTTSICPECEMHAGRHLEDCSHGTAPKDAA